MTIDPDEPTPDVPSVRAELVSSNPIEEDAGAGGAAPFDLGALLGGGGLDLGSLMEQASQMQQQVLAAQEEAAATVVEGVAGGGAVRIRVTGTGEFQSVHIDPAAVDPAEVDLLEDLVLAALHDVSARIDELRATSLSGFGDLGNLLGGGA